MGVALHKLQVGGRGHQSSLQEGASVPQSLDRVGGGGRECVRSEGGRGKCTRSEGAWAGREGPGGKCEGGRRRERGGSVRGVKVDRKRREGGVSVWEKGERGEVQAFNIGLITQRLHQLISYEHYFTSVFHSQIIIVTQKMQKITRITVLRLPQLRNLARDI